MVYALPCGLVLSGHGLITRALAALPGSCGLRHRGGDHHGPTDHHVLTRSAVCGTAARLGAARSGLNYRTVAEPEPPAAHRVGRGFISLYALAYIGGRLSDRAGRRKVFVLTASIVYGMALLVIARA